MELEALSWGLLSQWEHYPNNNPGPTTSPDPVGRAVLGELLGHVRRTAPHRTLDMIHSS